MVILPNPPGISVNQSAPSGPFVIVNAPEEFVGYSVVAPAVVILPMLPTVKPLEVPRPSANHNAPSAPTAIARGGKCPPSEYSVNFPDVVTRPIWP